MLTYDLLEKNIKDNKFCNSYIFCGQDEELIKSGINSITRHFITKELKELNYIRLDGNNLNIEDLINACETMPFMGEKKVVLVYRANFLKDKTDSGNEKVFKEVKEYLKNISPYTILIMYYIFSDKRETPKKNKKIMSLDKITTIVHCDKLKRDRFIKKIGEIFNEKGKNIGNIELRYFSEKVPNNFDIIKNEVDKLISYTMNREIRREDIDKLIPIKSEEDIFDLVDLISQKKVDKAIDVLDEILFKADQHMLIVVSIENQFKRLYEMKVGLQKGKKVEDFMKELRIPQFVCEKLINLTNKFTLRQLGNLIKLCVDCEIKLKSVSLDKRMELEMLLINTLTVKR